MIKTVYAADITKSYRDEDGRLHVQGVATSPDLDLDKQVCDPDWLKQAMPEWYEWGNVKAQHSELPAGHATDMQQLPGDKWWIDAVITEPVAADMAEAGTYKGFSVGIKDPVIVRDGVAKALGAKGGRIVGGKIVHVGMVDRPCNPVATLTLAKAAVPGVTAVASDFDSSRMLVKVFEAEEHPENAELPAEPVSVEDRLKALEAHLLKRTFTADERSAAADKGQALPDGSFPIKTTQDLKNAIRAIGRAKDPAKAKAHVKKRARALGAENLIPDSWKTAGADLAKAGGEQVHDPAEIAQVRDGLVALMKAELDELCDGENELCDIGELLCSLQLLMCWWDGEAAAGETANPYPEGGDPEVTQVVLGARADKEKAMADQDTTATTDTQTPDVTKAVAPDNLAELVKTAVAEASAASEERIKSLEAELVKVRETPVPGGPVLARTGADTQKAANAEKAAEYIRMADTVTDPDLRTFYRKSAQVLTQNGE